MKRTITLALALLMVISLAVTGYAAGIASPGGIQKPNIVVDPDDQGSVGDAQLDAKEVEEQLSEEKKAVFQESFEAVKDMEAVLEALPEEQVQMIQEKLGDEKLTAESLTPKFMYYFLPADSTVGPKDVKMDFAEMTESLDLEKAVFMQYVDGQWVVLEVVIGEDGIVTVKGMVEGPVCIFTL